MSMKKKAFGIALYILYLCIVLEVSSRTYWTWAHDVPFWQMGDIFYVNYPEAERVRQSYCGDDGMDVLLLGASVLNNRFGPAIEPLLSEQLGARHDQRVCIHNLSRSAHNTLDSYYKYQQLSDLSFDLVILYHGINDTRANNAPSTIFRNDYSHYVWYEKINALMQHREVNYVVFPYTIRYAYLEYKGRHNPHLYVPRHMPTDQFWIKMGATVKTKKAFRQNVTSILQLAESNSSLTAVMTFAYYLPSGYSKERLENGSLGYAASGRAMPVEVWGSPQNVVNGIGAHNQIIRDLAANEEGIHYVDQENAIPKIGRNFIDTCHLSVAGQKLWVDNLMDYLDSKTLKGG
jgi:hypothetical protein